MLKRLARAFLKRGAELAFGLGLVLTSFLAILVVGTVVFPEGRSLSTLVRDRASAEDSDLGDVSRTLRLSGSSTRQTEIARLEKIGRKVKDKPAKNIAWTDARPGMPLGERHSIQTFDRSSATIAFDAENQLELAENSLVVLRSFDRRADGGGRRASLLLSGGEIRGHIQSPAQGAVDIDMELPSGRARFRSNQEIGGAAQFRVEVDEKDEASRVSVFWGEAEVTTGDETVRIGNRQSLSIDPSGTMSPPIELPRAPRIISPRNERISYRTQPPPVTFAWRPVPRADRYVLRVAIDEDFRKIVFWTETRGTTFEHGKLGAGSYLWRVSAVIDGLEGAPSTSGRMAFVTDKSAPRLEVIWPTATVPADSFELQGSAEPGVHVFAANEPVALDAAGRFSHRIALRRGANVIVVEVVDALGNTTYETHIVNAEYGGETKP